jgi:hypothetical protein
MLNAHRPSTAGLSRTSTVCDADVSLAFDVTSVLPSPFSPARYSAAIPRITQTAVKLHVS